jgi:outer membrane biosynthesis protein TonB
MAKDGRLWRNVTLIALAHVALIAGLIRWSLTARASSSPESIVWLGSAQDLGAGESESGASPSVPAEVSTPRSEPKSLKTDEEERPVATPVKSEIELPSPAPKPTPTATPTPKPKATATSTPKPKETAKSVPKPTPKKTVVAKASPKLSPKAKPSEKSEKSEQKALAKTGSASASGSGKTGSGVRQGIDSPGRIGGRSSESEFGWYGRMLHDRFYSAWIQPTTNIATGTKISTLVKVRIEKDGRVSKFEIIKPSENVVVNESVAAMAKQVTQVDAPPAGLIKGDHYDVKINFELSTDRGTQPR